MTAYKTVARAGEAELEVKRSRFIGQIAPAQTAEAAMEFVAKVKAAHYDASHNVWAYSLRDGLRRYSDDGEPQGTAG
ncbi:MAG: YigZ family protein, partial [Oscillospiraceae bacterium]|nr:YigZ family protein [Oscillospiraceae bacterium]